MSTIRGHGTTRGSGRLRQSPPAAGGVPASRQLVGALLSAALLLAPWLARASDQRASEFWPELNATVRIDDHSRLFLLGTLARARDYATATDATWGVHYDRFAAQLPRRWVRALPIPL